jgi:APA family basic amino acid/polyamine antiporter
MPALKRVVGLRHAVLIGLGSILGTGAFVSIGIASSEWGDAAIWAIPIAGLVALGNGLSSAALASRFPVAGGTYEYASQLLSPWLGFTAGWLFLLAKTASAATAALGVALYLGTDSRAVPVATVLAMTALVLIGLRRSAAINMVLVAVTIAAIAWFAIGAFEVGSEWPALQQPTIAHVLTSTAFLFVAFTGYGRIATLAEEVVDPGRVIPRAVVLSLALATAVYMVIAIAGRSIGGPNWGSSVTLGIDGDRLVALGAITAMLGVLLNLILGLSRVWLAMARRRDMPVMLARLDARTEPVTAIAVTGALIALATLVADVRLTWSFSAMTVLLYYGITNLAAIALDQKRRSAWFGLAACLGLSFFVPPSVWLAGGALVLAGLVWKTWSNRRP